MRSNVKVITLLIRYYASVCVIWSHNKSVAVAQPEGSGGMPPPRNWVHKKIPGSAVELNAQNCGWFGSQIS